MTQRASTLATPGASRIDNDDLQVLLLHDFRYSLGVQTGAAIFCISNLKYYWEKLSPNFQAQIQQDISDYMAREKLSYSDRWKKILTLPLKDDPK